MSFGHIDIYGTTVAIDGTTIHGVDPTTIPFPKGSTGSKNTSTLDDGTIMAKGAKMYDPGSADISGNIINGDSGQGKLWDAFLDRALHTITITIPLAGEVFSYSARILKFEPGQGDDTYRWTATLDISGMATRAITFAGITSIEGAGAGITYFPSTANSALASDATIVIFHEATGITTDTVEVTAADADYIGISYDDGYSWAELTSGSAATFSTSYYPAAGAIGEALIKVEEAEKATRFVKLLMARASA